MTKENYIVSRGLDKNLREINVMPFNLSLFKTEVPFFNILNFSTMFGEWKKLWIEE